MSLTAQPAVGLLSKCQLLLGRAEEPATWLDLLDDGWPPHVASEVALLAWGLTMPMFRADRLPCPEVPPAAHPAAPQAHSRMHARARIRAHARACTRLYAHLHAR